MPVPKSVVKIKKDGLEFTSNVERVQYTLVELQRAALRDVAKFIRKRLIEKLKKLPGMRGSRRVYRGTQFWVRKRETDLIIGFKHGAWYSAQSELGEKNQPARGILRDTVYENIDEIQRIQGAYLSAIEDENKALGLIDHDGEPYYGKEDSDDD